MLANPKHAGSTISQNNIHGKENSVVVSDVVMLRHAVNGSVGGRLEGCIWFMVLVTFVLSYEEIVRAFKRQ
jgi:hypothetical protein